MYQVHNVSTKTKLAEFKRLSSKCRVSAKSLNGIETKSAYTRNGTLENIQEQHGSKNIYIYSTVNKNWYSITYSQISNCLVLEFHHKG